MPSSALPNARTPATRERNGLKGWAWAPVRCSEPESWMEVPEWSEETLLARGSAQSPSARSHRSECSSGRPSLILATASSSFALELERPGIDRIRSPPRRTPLGRGVQGSRRLRPECRGSRFVLDGATETMQEGEDLEFEVAVMGWASLRVLSRQLFRTRSTPRSASRRWSKTSAGTGSPTFQHGQILRRRNSLSQQAPAQFTPHHASEESFHPAAPAPTKLEETVSQSRTSETPRQSK